MKKTLKICTSVILAMLLIVSCICVGTVAPSAAGALTAGKVLYLKPNSIWLNGCPRFAAVFVQDTPDFQAWWMNMEPAGESGVYKVTVPGTHSWNRVIFRGMKPDTTTNSLDYAKYSTNSLYSNDITGDCFTIDYGQTGDVINNQPPTSDKAATGFWSTYDDTIGVANKGVYYLKPHSDWIRDCSKFVAMFYLGEATGDKYYQMTPVTGETGMYSVTIPTGSTGTVIFYGMKPGTADLPSGGTTSIVNANVKYKAKKQYISPDGDKPLINGHNCFTITDNTNGTATGSDEGATGSWSTYSTGITINDAVPGQTYRVYKILNLESYNAASNAYSYTVASGWEAFFAEGGGGYTYFELKNGYVYVKNGVTIEDDSANAIAFAKAAQAYASNKNIAPVATATAPAAPSGQTYSTLKFSLDGDLGYYLVDTSLGTICSLDTTNPNVIIEEKNDVPTVTNKVYENSTQTYGATNDSSIGETQKFQIKIKAQPGAENYYLRIGLGKGFTFKSTDGDLQTFATANNLKIEGLTYGTHYSVVDLGVGKLTGGSYEGGTYIVIKFEQSYLDTITSADTEIVLTYEAILNKDATIGSSGNYTKARVTYSENGNDNNGTTTDAPETITKTWQIELYKFTNYGADNTPLAGAKFTLTKNGASNPLKFVRMDDYNCRKALNDTESGASTIIETFTTGTNDSVKGHKWIKGLDSGTYILHEEEAPAGYNKLAGDITITVNSSNGSVSISGGGELDGNLIKIENKSGAELPMTGGWGTVVFYAVDAAAIIGIIAAIIVRRRRRAATPQR